MIVKYNEFVNETAGVNDVVISITKKLYNDLCDRILNSDKKQLIFKNIISSYNEFIVNDTIEININDDINSASFDKDDCLIVNNKLSKPYFIFNITIENKTIDYSFSGNINHELNHALEIYHLLRKNKLSNSSASKFLKLKEEHYDKYSDNKTWSQFLYVYYLMTDSEIRSRISELYDYLINSESTNKDELYFNYKNSPIYAEMLNVKKITFDYFIKNFEKSTSKEDILKIVNDFMQHKFNNKKSYSYDECLSFIKNTILDFNKKTDAMIKKLDNIYYKSLNDLKIQ